MNILNRFRSAALAIVALAVLSTPSFAQTVLNSTTLSAAVADGVVRQINLTSATGVTAPASGATGVVLLIDREVMSVLSISGTVATVTRATDARSVPHINGATVWIAPRQNVYATIPSGQCTRTLLQAVPYIVGGAEGLGSEPGSLWDCLGVTTAGQWVQTNGVQAGFPTLGTTVASPAGVLTPTGIYFKVSGTNAITGILNPAGIAPGFTLYLESTGIWTWTAAGNILTAGTTTAAGRVLILIWNGTKWAPSYIA
jgi:hypothetical protein